MTDATSQGITGPTGADRKIPWGAILWPRSHQRRCWNRLWAQANKAGLDGETIARNALKMYEEAGACTCRRPGKQVRGG